MAEYPKPFGNVGEPGSACRAGRIPEEGAQRPTSLDWVLGDVFLGLSYFSRAMDGEGSSSVISITLFISNILLIPYSYPIDRHPSLPQYLK